MAFNVVRHSQQNTLCVAINISDNVFFFYVHLLSIVCFILHLSMCLDPGTRIDLVFAKHFKSILSGHIQHKNKNYYGAKPGIVLPKNLFTLKLIYHK